MKDNQGLCEEIEQLNFKLGKAIGALEAVVRGHVAIDSPLLADLIRDLKEGDIT